MAFLSNPPVPYIGSVRGVSPGLLISVSGQPTSQAKWFAINLQCGPSMNPRDDIALHISPRFEGPVSKVIRNSLQGGQWGIEENFGHFPFAPDAPFEILVMVEADLFKIAINGQHFTEFRHRMPLGRINTLAIDGDLHLHVVRYEGGDAGIPPESAYQQPHLTSSGSYSMPIPTSGPSYGGGSGSNLQAQPYGAPHNTSGYQTAPGAGYGSGGQGYQSAPGPGYGSGGQGYQSAPGAPYSSPGFTHSGSGQNFSSPGYTGSGQGYSAPPAAGHTSQSYSGTGAAPGGSRTSDYLKMGGAAAVGALGGFAVSRLIYPGGGGMGHGGMFHGKKGKKMKKHGGVMGQFPHKLKHHKVKHGKMKKWHKKGSSSSSSSSSSSEEE